MRLAVLALMMFATTASAQTQQPDAAKPLTFLCSGIEVRTDSNGSAFNTAGQFRLRLWKDDPWRGTVEGLPIKDLAVTDDAVVFTPPAVSGLHSLLRAYADIASLGAAVKSRVMRIDRQTGAYRSGYASGICKLVSASERLF